MIRGFLALVSLFAVNTAFCDATGGSPDPAFKDLDFDHWPEKDTGARFRWTTRIGTPALSEHQRLMVKVEMHVEGSERVKYQGKGKILMLVQFRDASGAVYQAHNSLPLDNVDADTARTETIYTQEVFVVPGDYQVSTGLFVTGAKEHAVNRKTLRVDALRHDPLPDAWRDLPPVEIVPSEDPPDSWYLPEIEGRLRLDLNAKRPVRIDVVVNASKTEQPAVRISERRRHVYIGSLIPETKVLSGIKLDNGSVEMTMLDLEHRRVTFEQSMKHDLDWEKLKDALGAGDQNKIDVKSLEHRDENAQYFLSQIQSRLADTGTLHAVIVLSGPMAFDKANMQPIQAAPNANNRIYYLRYHPVMMFPDGPSMAGDPVGRTRRLGRNTNPLNLPPAGNPAVDELFGLLKPIDPRLFEISNPAEFRKALASILRDIARFASGGPSSD